MGVCFPRLHWLLVRLMPLKSILWSGTGQRLDLEWVWTCPQFGSLPEYFVKRSWCESAVLQFSCLLSHITSLFTPAIQWSVAFGDTIKLSNLTFCLQSSKQFIHSHERISQVIYALECVTCLILGKVWKVNTVNSSKKAARLTETTVLYAQGKPAVLIISGQTQRELPLHSGTFVQKQSWKLIDMRSKSVTGLSTHIFEGYRKRLGGERKGGEDLFLIFKLPHDFYSPYAIMGTRQKQVW